MASTGTNAELTALTGEPVSRTGGGRLFGSYQFKLSDKVGYDTIPMETGSSSGGIARMLTNGYDFCLLNCTPTSSDLKATDDFFTAYGYRVDKWGVPAVDFSKNVGDNESFFLKTGAETCCTSSVREAQEQFDAMCNAGIRFWKTEIGQKGTSSVQCDYTKGV